MIFSIQLPTLGVWDDHDYRRAAERMNRSAPVLSASTEDGTTGGVRPAVSYQFEEDGSANPYGRAVARLEALKVALEEGPPRAAAAATAAATAAVGLGQPAGAGGTV